MNIDFANLLEGYLPLVTTFTLATLMILAYRYVVIIWPSQTHRINKIPRQLGLAFLILAALVAVILALPINENEKGQLLNLLGILITAAIALSSTTFVGNAMAGLMLKSIKNVKVGDFLKIDGHFGKVVEQGFLHTEIQTEDSDLTTFPNLFLINNPFKVIRSTGTILQADVSLGYDVSWKRIEESLKRAAEEAGLRDPFVYVSNLGDYSVTYTAAGFLDEVKYLLSHRSKLRKAMLDSLHEDDIEIVSPSFMNQKQILPEKHFIPKKVRQPEIVEDLPEDQIFDVADEAAGKEELKERLMEVIAELKELTDSIKTAETEKDKLELEHRETNLLREKQYLEKMLKENKEKE